jgi:hypothetical protein
VDTSTSPALRSLAERLDLPLYRLQALVSFYPHFRARAAEAPATQRLPRRGLPQGAERRRAPRLAGAGDRGGDARRRRRGGDGGAHLARGTDEVLVVDAVSPGKHVGPAVVARGRRLRPQDAAALAATERQPAVAAFVALVDEPETRALLAARGLLP